MGYLEVSINNGIAVISVLRVNLCDVKKTYYNIISILISIYYICVCLFDFQVNCYVFYLIN